MMCCLIIYIKPTISQSFSQANCLIKNRLLGWLFLLPGLSFVSITIKRSFLLVVASSSLSVSRSNLINSNRIFLWRPNIIMYRKYDNKRWIPCSSCAWNCRWGCCFSFVCLFLVPALPPQSAHIECILRETTIFTMCLPFSRSRRHVCGALCLLSLAVIVNAAAAAVLCCCPHSFTYTAFLSAVLIMNHHTYLSLWYVDQRYRCTTCYKS